ncbi:MAG: hypothetical protein COU11_00795 [Candidatus Harrisonbacteria bacterium CG10_big_fil_rev_8_21_14_0_10_49_15]|uniref:Uncharacterized protein n=1 Tax=Candidatus Harrisonbacteria bacterium CG10_big_fil_rev_8_21_14_0_10_49_15 TaxID=1974587 RepID=A0A2H0ULR3_9BACT|nr:MAG: hypothetical protein COU11_00795 [Candidatus Harrisonbacteria bacterium CG10_big_fil_rev_8_21_14_0_10_49_15]
MKRRTKQFIYGGSYLSVILIIFASVFAIVHEPVLSCFDGKLNQNEEEVDCGGVCASCALKTVRPIQLGTPETVIISAGSGSASQLLTVVELRNPNNNFSAGPITYELGIFTQGGELIDVITRTTILYASEVRYEIQPVSITGATGVTVLATTTATQWLEVEKLARPNSQIRSQREEYSPDQRTLTVTGIYKNTNTFSVREVELHALIRDTGGSLAGVGKTLIRDLAPDEERAFQIVLPLAVTIAPEDLASPIISTAIRRL